MLSWPGQVVIAGCQVFWTTEVSEALDQGDLAQRLYPQLQTQVLSHRSARPVFIHQGFFWKKLKALSQRKGVKPGKFSSKIQEVGYFRLKHFPRSVVFNLLHTVAKASVKCVLTMPITLAPMEPNLSFTTATMAFF